MWDDVTKIKKYSILSGGFGVSFKDLQAPCSMHFHDFCELEFFESGAGKQKINGIEFDICPGSISFLKYGDLHQLLPAENVQAKLINVFFDYTFLHDDTWEILHEIQTPLVVKLSVPELAYIKKICADLQHASKKTNENIHYIKCGLNWLLAILLQKKQEAGRGFSPINSPIYHAIAYINKNFSSQIKLSDVARQLHYAPRYFSQYFHKTVGISFRDYLLATRLHFAMVLLKISDLSVTDICFECGFTSLSHFSRTFSRKYGHSPSFYLKR